LNELTFAAMPAMNAASRPVMRDAEHAVGQVLVHQLRDRVVVGQVAVSAPMPRTITDAIRPGTMITNGMQQLRPGADHRGQPRRVHALGRQRALDLGEVRRPVAEREHEAEAEDDRDPVADRAFALPTPVPCQACSARLAELGRLRSCRSARSTADLDERDDRQRHQDATITKNCSTSL
jgi:hypothetical protein